MRLPRPLLVSLLVASAFLLPAADQDPVAALEAAWQDGVAELTTAYNALAGMASDAYAALAAKADAEAVQDLVREARVRARDGDAESARLAWLEVLRIDLQHVDARAYFAGLGTLDQALDQALGALPAEPAAADLLGGGAASAPERVVPAAFAGILTERDAARAAALEDFHQAEAKAREKFAKYEQRLREKVVRKLESLAKAADRKGALPAANAAWRAVLRLDRDHADARAAFAAQGALETVVAELGDAITVETLLGPVPEPSTGYFGLRGDGRRILVVKHGSDPLQPAIIAHLEELGFEVEIAKEVDREGIALVLAVETSDATFGTVSHAADYLDVPVVVVHPKLLIASRLIPDDAQYPHEAPTSIATIADPAHPMAARLSGEVEILSPAAALGDEVVELRAYQREAELGPDAQVVVTMDGVPAIVAWEAGSAFADPPHEREKDKARIAQTRNAGRVVGLFLFTDADPELLTRDAWLLLDAGIAWALAR